MNSVIENQQDLAHWARLQKSRLDMAVAFWGEGALAQLGIEGNRKARVLLDLSAGGTNPKVVRDLQKLERVQVRQLDRLHAKVYIGDCALVIGSANASSNGLGAEGHEASHWTELSLRSSCPDTLAQLSVWFTKQWRKGRVIDDADLRRAETAWANRRRARPATARGSILDIARTNPEELKDRRIFVVVSTEDFTGEEQKTGDAAAAERGIDAHYWVDWEEMPLSATLICFGCYDGKSIAKDNPQLCTTPPKRTGRFNFVARLESLGEYNLGDDKEWKRRLRYHRAMHPHVWSDEGGPCVEIAEFVRLTNDALLQPVKRPGL